MKFLICPLIAALLLPPQSASQDVPVINPERDQLLQNALSWLTLRSNGDLLTDSQSSPYLETLRERYKSSKYYRSFVIAFQLGVLPKLILSEGESCDPTYPKQFKDPYNNSVTWYKQKSFTLDNYYISVGKYSGSYVYPPSYCDYRQGLVCLSKTGECGCPEGTTMDTIAPSSQDKRCVLDENEVCSFVDLEEDQIRDKLKDNLYHFIFNLEKPPGCKHGTQCRYSNSEDIPRCYNSAGSWTKPRDEFEYGDECVLDLHADKGICGISYNPSYDTQMICYNYWGHLANKPLPSSLTSTRVGSCALEFAPFLTNTMLRYKYTEDIGVEQVEPFVKAYLNPRNVPLRSYDLLDYDDRVQEITENYLSHRMVETDGASCSVDETKELEDHWKFYAALEATPPPGQDYVADDSMLDDELNEMENLVGTPAQGRSTPKLCRIMWQKKLIAPGTIDFKYPYECVSNGGAADSNGHDGTCQRSNNNESLAFAESVYEFFLHFNKGKWSIEREESEVDEEILKNNPEVKETECVQSHIDNTITITPSCANNQVCYEDLSDSSGIYLDSKLCVIEPSIKIKNACHNVSKPSDELGICETKMLRKKVSDLFEKLPRLAHGETCVYQRDWKIRNMVAGDDDEDIGYYMLVTMEQMESRGEGICDATRLLECSALNTCQCITDTARRVMEVEDVGEYFSDFCYAKNGGCKTDITRFVSMTQSEKDRSYYHYGNYIHINTDCSNGNICVYIDTKSATCTTSSTGKTGVDGPEKGTTEPSSWQYAGEIERAKPYESGSISIFIFNLRVYFGITLMVMCSIFMKCP